MKTVSISFIMLFVFLPPDLSAQVNAEEEFIHQVDEWINETGNEDLAKEEISELYEIFSDKTDINQAGANIIGKIPFITSFQVHSFLEYRQKFGKIYSLNELRLIPGFHEDLIRSFSFLFDFDDFTHNSMGSYQNKFRQKILLRSKIEFPPKEGFNSTYDSASHFLGIPLYRMIKYEIKKKNQVKAGFTLENDAGESSSFDSLGGMADFLSAYLELTGKKIFDKIIVGDYKISSAEGMIYSHGLVGKFYSGFFKKKIPELKKYSSTSEYGFYRGIAGQFSRKNLRLITFLSRVGMDSKIYRDVDGEKYFTSPDQSGFHRNEKEMIRKNRVSNRSTGLILSFTSDRFQAGYNMKYTRFDPSLGFRIRGDHYSELNISNRHLWHSVFLNLQLDRIFFSGELGKIKNGGFALQQKVSLRIHPLFYADAGYRYFSRNYFCPGSGSLSEKSNLQNETGFFCRFISYPFSFLELRLYIDQYSFPWLDNNLYFPSEGVDFIIDTEWFLLENMGISVYFKCETKNSTSSGVNSPLKTIPETITERFYFQSDYKINDRLSSRFRVELKDVKENNSSVASGLLLYQELSTTIPSARVKLNLRYTVFDIPGWKARIYSWEHDLLYSFSFTSFYKTGQNIFLNLRWKCKDFLNLGLKISYTSYNAQRETGSGSNYRKAQNFYQLKAQCLFSL